MAAIKKSKTLQIRPYQPPQQQQQRSKKLSSSATKEKVISVEEDAVDNGVDEEEEEEKEEEEKKSRGSWTPEKQLVLLQKYAEHFPPGAPWGKSTEAWKKIVDSVNAVTPDDTPLGYDACRRTVDKMSDRYLEEASIKKAALETLSKRDKHDDDKAEKLLKQQSKKERKRLKRLIIQKLANERRAEHSNMESITNHDNSETSNPLPSMDSSTTSSRVACTRLDEAYIREQREFQKSVLGHLENISNLLKAFVNQ